MKLNFIDRIIMPTYVSFVKYATVGVIGTLIHTLILSFCVEVLEFVPIISTCIGFLFSLIVSYILNSLWTFKQKNKNSFFKYFITCSLGLVINVLIMFIVVDLLKYLYLIGQALAIIIVPVFNFFLSKKWVFNQ